MGNNNGRSQHPKKNISKIESNSIFEENNSDFEEMNKRNSPTKISENHSPPITEKEKEPEVKNKEEIKVTERFGKNKKVVEEKLDFTNKEIVDYLGTNLQMGQFWKLWKTSLKQLLLANGDFQAEINFSYSLNFKKLFWNFGKSENNKNLKFFY